jgi:hypothetical protein
LKGTATSNTEVKSIFCYDSIRELFNTPSYSDVVGYDRFGGPCSVLEVGGWGQNIPPNHENPPRHNPVLQHRRPGLEHFVIIMKFSLANSQVKWLKGEKADVSMTISVLILTFQPLDPAGSSTELYYT